MKAFGGVRALDGATLGVPEGAVYGLAGPNGAGKSTLVRHLAGVYRPDAGSVRVGGRDPYADSSARAGISCVYDEVFAYSHATLRDLARLEGRLFPRFDRARFDALRDVFPEIDAKAPMRRMSRGMRKQAALWLALSREPSVLLLDEPVDGLDPMARRRFWGYLAGEAAGRGMTVLVCTHNLRELAGACTHVGFIDHGRVVAERDAAGLSGEDLEALFAEALGFGGGAPVAGAGDDAGAAAAAGAGSPESAAAWVEGGGDE